MIWFIVGGLVAVGLAGWAWVHYKNTATAVLDKTGSVVDNAVNKIEDTINKH